MEFWKWYWSNIKRALTLKWVKYPGTEYLFAIIGTLLLAAVLSITLTYFWLILVLPVGFTTIAHANWRYNKQINAQSYHSNK